MKADESMDLASGGRSADEQIDRIREAITTEAKRLETKYPILKKRDLLGTATCLLCCAGMLVMGALYIRGVVPWWVTVLVSGFFAGMLNEVEHDLMHNIYFKYRTWPYDALMILVWAFRGNYMNPWNRRKLHLHHHKTSGSHIDVETRMTGLGMSWSLIRVLLMVDTLWVVLVRKRLEREAEGHYTSRETLLNMIPFTWMFLGMWVSVLGFQAFFLVNWLFKLQITLGPTLASYWHFLSIAWVVYLAPSQLRTAALHIISSNTHYTGAKLHVLHQTQSQGAWFFWPLQPFCFNFGKTHCIHHIVVQQPYYLRQMVADTAYKAMRENGVLFNDYGTFARRNAYPPQLSAADG